MNDFCFCELSPVLVGLGVCLTTTAIGLATWLFWSKRQQNKRFPLHTLYPGWAFVSGASSGVGRKTCTVLAALNVEGIVLHASPKSQTTLEALAEEINQATGGRVKTRVVTGDLSDAEQVTSIIDRIKDLKISILVNNAGFGANGQFDKIPLETQLTMISVNCAALLQLTHHVVEQHRKRSKSIEKPEDQERLAIVNLGSIAAAPCGLPWQTTYAATKAFVSSFSHGIAYSLKGDGVRVVLVEPGTIVETAFQERSEQPLHGGHNTPASVVTAFVDALQRPNSPKYHLIPDYHDNITFYASKYLPDWLILMLGAKRGLKYSPADKR